MVFFDRFSSQYDTTWRKPLISSKYAVGKELIYNIYIAYLAITAIREICYADDFIHISRSSGAIESKTQSLVRVTCSM